MKRNYEIPSLEITRFETEDVLTTSFIEGDESTTLHTDKIVVDVTE